MREFQLWKAYYDLDPFGPERNDAMIAQLTAQVANVLRVKPPFAKTTDFLPRFGPREPQTAQKMLALARLYNEALGGIDKTKKKEAHG